MNAVEHERISDPPALCPHCVLGEREDGSACPHCLAHPGYAQAVCGCEDEGDDGDRVEGAG